MYIEPWIGVDLDKTIAMYDGWKGDTHIGEPIPEMIDRVKTWIDSGHTVKVFTARIGRQVTCDKQRQRIVCAIQRWTNEHIGRRLEVTCSKDVGMTELWDDRVVSVVPNTGKIVGV